ncbi:prepilin-type N-terminal cleavage/methylation domain-containing protein [Pseudoxanthomonas sp. PXM01]|uniref:type II secretion system protein XpsI n=1 Tax=Pseudoxanthomonas sp. PXM01 TaxID=2769295 RepID=UPI001780F733|nr:prepilin-type N-terminal cleavage/methylation domain-containing protein [Pseudoxanthomonas sp. PXM01]MBD9468827.1 prepilin-type N-terminal cleavage/methylation domain-containing protein [Pseudoxanthomonas sp. PXM01]
MIVSRRRQQGFTLLEVIVAFALLALALSLLLGSLSGASRQVRESADSSRATLHAQSLLAQLGAGEALQPGRQQGSFEGDRYRWQLDVAPFADPLAARAQLDPSAPQLLDVRLTVGWGSERGQAMEWRTLRLAPRDINQAVSP